MSTQINTPITPAPIKPPVAQNQAVQSKTPQPAATLNNPAPSIPVTSNNSAPSVPATNIPLNNTPQVILNPTIPSVYQKNNHTETEEKAAAQATINPKKRPSEDLARFAAGFLMCIGALTLAGFVLYKKNTGPVTKANELASYINARTKGHIQPVAISVKKAIEIKFPTERYLSPILLLDRSNNFLTLTSENESLLKPFFDHINPDVVQAKGRVGHILDKVLRGEKPTRNEMCNLVEQEKAVSDKMHKYMATLNEQAKGSKDAAKKTLLHRQAELINDIKSYGHLTGEAIELTKINPDRLNEVRLSLNSIYEVVKRFYKDGTSMPSIVITLNESGKGYEKVIAKALEEAGRVDSLSNDILKHVEEIEFGTKQPEGFFETMLFNKIKNKNPILIRIAGPTQVNENSPFSLLKRLIF